MEKIRFRYEFFWLAIFTALTDIILGQRGMRADNLALDRAEFFYKKIQHLFIAHILIQGGSHQFSQFLPISCFLEIAEDTVFFLLLLRSGSGRRRL
ncbi:MAG: hypothetical protein D3914_14405 [Candidatus Electrothrix sp. LOE2]|nr:hypothetical protein [Candidatus Electrothrix sp. LOE2]